ncbi:spermidine synthase [Saccharopolyspora shandongensis]|uniref:spermidine synthase n=1 Tax=Saccharopolyspora shandongensis TaxID=418495 RepID=UPI0034069DF9
MTEQVARNDSERGELVLLRREGVLELRVNGVFVMDTLHTETERLLAGATLRAAARTDRVLVGGLGLGFTLREVLADPRVREAHVVEIEPDLIDWHRRGLVPETADAIRDDRVVFRVGDVAEVLDAQPPGSFDVLLLDVDNGPDFLVYDGNSALYRADFLFRCREKLTPAGIVAIWSADASPDLSAAMREVFGNCEEIPIPVTLGQQETTYHLFLGRRAQE